MKFRCCYDFCEFFHVCWFDIEDVCCVRVRIKMGIELIIVSFRFRFIVSIQHDEYQKDEGLIDEKSHIDQHVDCFVNDEVKRDPLKL